MQPDLLETCLTTTDRTRAILAASVYVQRKQRAREDRRAFWLACVLTVIAGAGVLVVAHWGMTAPHETPQADTVQEGKE